MSETTQLKWFFGADLSNLVYVDAVISASRAQPLQVSCSLEVTHPASSVAVNLSGRFCFLLWANWAVLGASGFQPPLLVSKSYVYDFTWGTWDDLSGSSDQKWHLRCLLLKELSNTLMSARQILLLPIRWELIVLVLEQNQAEGWLTSHALIRAYVSRKYNRTELFNKV